MMHTTTMSATLYLKTNQTERNYSFIKSQKCDESGVSTLKENGKMQSTPSEKAETLNRKFSSVFTQEETNNLSHLPESTIHTLPDIQVTERGVRILLEYINPKKASGPDEVSSRFLKEMASSASAPLTQIFQASFD